MLGAQMTYPAASKGHQVTFGAWQGYTGMLRADDGLLGLPRGEGVAGV